MISRNLTALEKALLKIEEERCRVLTCKKLTVDEILSSGPVVYVRDFLTDTMRRDAHACAVRRNNDTQDTDRSLLEAYQTLWLTFFKAQKYYDDVDLHIHYIKELGRILLPHNAALQERLAVHDCSKYGYDEVYGYILRWTHGLEDCKEWDIALNHHLTNNDHHPEFFNGKTMSTDALLESVVDMLSWRLIKNRLSNADKRIESWLFDVEEKFLLRYLESDRIKVRAILHEWKELGYNFENNITLKS